MYWYFGPILPFQFNKTYIQFNITINKLSWFLIGWIREHFFWSKKYAKIVLGSFCVMIHDPMYRYSNWNRRNKLTCFLKLNFDNNNNKSPTLTYDQIYLRSLMLNNSTTKIIYDNYKLAFCHNGLRNDNIIWFKSIVYEQHNMIKLLFVLICFKMHQFFHLKHNTKIPSLK